MGYMIIVPLTTHDVVSATDLMRIHRDLFVTGVNVSLFIAHIYNTEERNKRMRTTTDDLDCTADSLTGLLRRLQDSQCARRGTVGQVNGGPERTAMAGRVIKRRVMAGGQPSCRQRPRYLLYFK